MQKEAAEHRVIQGVVTIRPWNLLAMKATHATQTTGERVMRGEFEQIARNLATRIAQEQEQVVRRSAAHRSTHRERRKLAVLSQALSRIDALRSRLS